MADHALEDGAPLRAVGAPPVARVFAAAGGSGAPLRIALVLDDPCSAFGAAVVEDLAAASFVQVVLIIGRPVDGTSRATIVDAGKDIAGGYPRPLRWLERRREDGLPADTRPERSAPQSAWPAGAARLQVTDWDALDPSVAATIAGCDLVAWCAQGLPPVDALGIAQFGCWSLCSGRTSASNGRRTRIPEIIHGEGETEVLLQARRSLDAAPDTLCSAVIRRPATMHLADMSHELAWEGRHFFVRAMSELHRFGWDATRQRAGHLAAPFRSLDESVSPLDATLCLAMTSFAKLGRRIVRRQVFGEDWHLALRPREAQRGSPLSEPVSWTQAEPLPAPPGEYWADPFLVDRDGTAYLFFENLRRRAGYGVISVCELDSRGRCGPVIDCLDTGNHLSYPQVFAHGGEMFMVPESASVGRVDLYRARRFPDDWVLEATLFHGLAVDTTCVEREGQWYFFTSLSDFGNQFPVQLLFRADGLTGGWQLHPSSPVSTGVERERGAGAIFEAEPGRWCRPVQHNLRGYGHSIQFLELQVLDRERCVEAARTTVEPTWAPDLKGTHTYARSARWEAIDFLRERRTNGR